MIIPRSISVTVMHRGRPASEVLVWINFLALGSDYYRTHVGLSNAEGVAHLTGEQLRSSFKEDQTLFPMDYRLALEECDDEIVVGIEGGAAFAEHRTAALAGPFTTPTAKRNWTAATNESLQSVRARRRLSRPEGEDVSIVLEAR